jgi:hypothetical protein
VDNSETELSNSLNLLFIFAIILGLTDKLNQSILVDNTSTEFSKAENCFVIGSKLYSVNKN